MQTTAVGKKKQKEKDLKHWKTFFFFYLELFGTRMVLFLCICTMPGADLQLASLTFITTQIIIKTEQTMHFVPAVNCPIKGKTK